MTPDSAQTVLLLGGKLGDSDERGKPEDQDFEISSDDEEDIRIEEAVISLARATFVRGWRLAFRHDPVVTPLALEVAMEYWQSLPGEDRGLETRRFSIEPVVIFGPELKDDDREAINHALHIGCARFVAKPRLTEPFVSRVVCIGGSTEVADYISWLNNNASNVPIFTIPSTGGAAYDLKDRAGIANPERGITEIIVSRRSEMHFDPPRQETSPDLAQGFRHPIDLEPERIPQFRYALYPLLVNAILDSEPGGRLW
jgi:hypothetical protein